MAQKQCRTCRQTIYKAYGAVRTHGCILKHDEWMPFVLSTLANAFLLLAAAHPTSALPIQVALAHKWVEQACLAGIAKDPRDPCKLLLQCCQWTHYTQYRNININLWKQDSTINQCWKSQGNMDIAIDESNDDKSLCKNTGHGTSLVVTPHKRIAKWSPKTPSNNPSMGNTCARTLWQTPNVCCRGLVYGQLPAASGRRNQAVAPTGTSQCGSTTRMAAVDHLLVNYSALLRNTKCAHAAPIWEMERPRWNNCSINSDNNSDDK